MQVADQQRRDHASTIASIDHGDDEADEHAAGTARTSVSTRRSVCAVQPAAAQRLVAPEALERACGSSSGVRTVPAAAGCPGSGVPTLA